MNFDQIRINVRNMVPEVVHDLKELIRYPSIAFPGYPPDPVHRMARATVELLRRYGLSTAYAIDIPGGYPLVYGEFPAPPNSPTVLMYAHYDVQPAKKDGWEGDPFTPYKKAGRLYGRGAADDKSGIIMNAATIRCFEGRPPVGVKLVIEGEEETTSHLHGFIPEHPDFFQCDLCIVTDNGNLTVGDPVLTTTLRGEVSCRITVTTLDHPVHSGSFGGPTPDAFMALLRILSTLQDQKGNVALAGLASSQWEGSDFPEELFRDITCIHEGVDLIGSGPLSSRLWSKPSISVIGIDAPTIQEASNILIPKAAAAVSMRISPGADPDHEVQLLMDHLRKVAPWHVLVDVRRISASPGFICPTDGPGYILAKQAMERAFGKPVSEIGAGGSIPLLKILKRTVPKAEFILWGSEDLALSRIHGTNESVDIGEIERMILAQCLLLNFLSGKKE
ncbi:MAG: M20/M25/M40 family metallo-hydrolase [Methanomicrobiales archaeon]|nr:M20/M25/M40 family metallo-hydrolase [Methanomicrobiales archaeon]